MPDLSVGEGQSLPKLFISNLINSKRKFILTLITISLFWWVSLFPGRLGYDSSLAIRMLQNGESTNWWTSSFWWFLRLSTFGGRTIAFSSALSLTILGTAIYYFAESIPQLVRFSRLSAILLFCSPIYGAFGVNVSHDVFLSSFIILTTGLQIRLFSKAEAVSRKTYLWIIFSGILSVSTHYGLIIAILLASTLVIQKYNRLAAVIFVTVIMTSFFSSFGVTKVPTFGLIQPIVSDIKCVVQHPQADVTDTNWQYLSRFAPKVQWTTQVKCSSFDAQLSSLPDLDLKKMHLNFELIKTYAELAGKNPAIIGMSHIQKASIALPPPFFAGPVNQIDLNPEIPIGLGTNTALQSHAGVLHPSIDEVSVAKKIHFLKPLEVIAQAGIFLVNQASWFWGWGGLWLWPFALFILIFIKNRMLATTFPIFMSTFSLHALLVVFAAPLPRYVMSTIIMGVYCTILLLITISHRFILSKKSIDG
jgi:hypothetical protein